MRSAGLLPFVVGGKARMCLSPLSDGGASTLWQVTRQAASFELVALRNHGVVAQS